MTEADNEIRLLLDKPRRGKRQKKAVALSGMENVTVAPMRQRHLDNTTGAPAFANKETMENLAFDSSEIMLKEAGAGSDPEYRHLLLVRLVQQGVRPTRAATMVGFESKMQGNRVMDRYRKNPRFRKKVDDLADRMRQSYVDSKVASLPLVSEIEAAALKEYQADPLLAVNKPKLLRDIRITAGVQQPDGGVVINQGISVESLERMQRLFQGALTHDSGGGNVLDAEVVSRDDAEGKG